MAEPFPVGDGPMHALRDPNDPDSICGEPILFRGGEGSEWNRHHIDACSSCLQLSPDQALAIDYESVL